MQHKIFYSFYGCNARYDTGLKEDLKEIIVECELIAIYYLVPKSNIMANNHVNV